MRIQLFKILFVVGFFMTGCSHAPVGNEKIRLDYLSDLETIKDVISQNYLNLEWASFHQQLDLPKMSFQARQAMTVLESPEEGFKILQEFVNQFHDDHLFLQKLSDDKPGFRQSVLPKIDRSQDGSLVCFLIAKNIETAPISFKLPAHFRPLKESKVFRAGTLSLGKKNVGIIRIPTFDETQYYESCVQEWDRFRKGFRADPLDLKSLFAKPKMQKVPDLAIAAEKTEAVPMGSSTINLNKAEPSQIGASKPGAKVADLKVDLYNKYIEPEITPPTTMTCDTVCWDSFLVRLRNRLLREFAGVLLELNHRKVEILLLDLQGTRGDYTWEASLRQMLTDKPLVCGDVLNLKPVSDRNCDRHWLWSDRNYTPACNLATVIEAKTCVSSPEYIYAEGIYRGSLFVLVNSETAEAGEDLASRLQDNLVSLVVGKPTKGSGCGLRSKGEEYSLGVSNAKLLIPTCARKRLTGENEIAPIVPDLLIAPESSTDEFSKEVLRQISFR
jgi:hypothetical protein